MTNAEAAAVINAHNSDAASVWDRYAAAALQGIIASIPDASYADAATDAAGYADAMILARTKAFEALFSNSLPKE